MASAVRRRLRPVTENVSKIYSTSKPGKETEYKVMIDESGVSCTCPHFQYRLAGQFPTIHTPEKWCKHILRQAENMVRKAG